MSDFKAEVKYLRGLVNHTEESLKDKNYYETTKNLHHMLRTVDDLMWDVVEIWKN